MEKRVNLEDVCRRKYIYLDWNVFKYIKEPRIEDEELDKSVKEIVIRTRNKYVYPFSEAHLRDRVNKYKPEYREKVEEDLSFVENISEGYCLAYRPDKGWIQPIKQSITEVFEQIISLENKPLDLSAVYPDMVPFEVNNNEFENDELLSKFLSEEKVALDRNTMGEFVERIFWECFDSKATYNTVRKQEWQRRQNKEERCINDIYFNVTQKKLEQLINCYETADVEYIIENWKNAIIDAISIHYPIQEISGEGLICCAYCMLDWHPMFRDKLGKKNTFSNIVRDAKHAWYASQARMFVTEDEHTRKKCEVLYKAFGIKTTVLSMKEFCARMDFC